MSASLYGADFFAGRSPLVRQSAAAVVPVLMELLEPESVLDVGCGEAEWLTAFVARGVTDYGGVDIAITTQVIADNYRFYSHDLTRPLDLGHTFDLVLCLEVGEHLPEESADTLVDTLVRHGGDIVFGAAVPGQEGVGHINCQPHTYWHTKFGERGYWTYDTIRPRIANDPRVSPWYRNNMFLYVRRT